MTRFKQLEDFPYLLKGRMNSYITTSFDDSMTVEMQIRVLIEWIKKNIEMTNTQSDYLNEFINTFDDSLFTTVQDIMQKWLEDGVISDLVSEIILKIGHLNEFREFDPTVIEKMSNEFHEQYYNVKWFGAKGDGVTDDTQAIQQAIDKAHITGSNVVYFPKAVYNVQEIVWKYGVTLKGDHATLKAMSTTNALIKIDTGSISDELQALEISGFYLDGRNTTNATGLFVSAESTDKKEGGGLWHCTLKDLLIFNFTKCIHFRAIDDTRGDNANQYNTFTNVHAYPSQTTTDSRALLFEGQIGQTRFIDCEFNGKGSTGLENTAVVELISSSNANDQIFGPLDFTNTTFQTCDLAIKTSNVQNLVLKECWFEQCQNAIELADNSFATLCNNHFASISYLNENGVLLNLKDSSSATGFGNFIQAPKGTHVLGTNENRLADVEFRVYGSSSPNYKNTERVLTLTSSTMYSQGSSFINLISDTINLQNIISTKPISSIISIRNGGSKNIGIFSGGNIILPTGISSIVLEPNEIIRFYRSTLNSWTVYNTKNIEVVKEGFTSIQLSSSQLTFQAQKLIRVSKGATENIQTIVSSLPVGNTFVIYNEGSSQIAIFSGGNITLQTGGTYVPVPSNQAVQLIKLSNMNYMVLK